MRRTDGRCARCGVVKLETSVELKQRECRGCQTIRSRIYYKNNPWMRRYSYARSRCNDRNDPSYYCYGGRGIKFLLTIAEIKTLWIRDDAELMKCASIDRIDNDGNYEFTNCQFIELSENTKKQMRERIRKTHCLRGHPLSGDNLREHKNKRVCRTCEKIRHHPGPEGGV